MEEEIIVYLLSIDLIKNNLDKYLHYLPLDRINKANRYIFDNDRYLSIAGSYLIMKHTDSSPIYINKNGKPYKKGYEFSISHSGIYAAYCMYDKPIGIDIQKHDKYHQNIESFVLSESERKQIKTPNDFYSLWAIKESLAKCIGIGLRGDFKNIPALTNVYRYKNVTYSTSADTSIKDYSLAVTVSNNAKFKIKIVFDE